MLSADGCIEVLTPEYTNCCPPPLCGNDLCCTFVAFFNLLPSGPLWDYWKQAAISYFQHSDDASQCPLIQDPDCPSLVLHTIYTVLKLKGLVYNALWPALRESNPYTAITTLDDWLLRLRWEDCYNQHCRSVLLGEITPMEIWTECGPLFCPPTFTEDLQLALKHGIVVALTRANMGVIKNLCGINWIIDPLGAEIIPNIVSPPVVDQGWPTCDPAVCTNNQFLIHRTRDWLEGVGSGDICDTLTPRPQIPADGGRGCDRPAGLPDEIWPGILAAECIVRSMMPVTCPPNISREC
jgi:hypothetical protein